MPENPYRPPSTECHDGRPGIPGWVRLVAAAVLGVSIGLLQMWLLATWAQQ